MSADSQRQGVGRSYEAARSRFGTPDAAAIYATRLRGQRRDRVEQKCIAKALQTVPRGAKVLDLPCGTGRLLGLLVQSGFDVTEADSSPHMIEQARALWEELRANLPGPQPQVSFEVRDVMRSGYQDEAFDAVLCNRLLHHFTEPGTRTAALAELRRISRGPVIVSFFNSMALDALVLGIRSFLRRRTPTDRIPISMSQFLADAGKAGLELDQAFPTRWGISPQWYVRLLSRKRP
jgi:2-polyprenyl-3-methyl-5-hydroxy-6-metoxy-1,4-benzoquinol methylase